MPNFKLITGGACVIFILSLFFICYKKGEKDAQNACLLQENIETIKIQEKIIYVKENQQKTIANIKHFDNNNRLEFMQRIWTQRAESN